MKYINKALVSVVFIALSPLFVFASQYWGGEMPDVSNASVTASVRLEENVFYYEYAVTNPASNTGEIWSIDVDITKPRNTGRVSSVGLPSHDPGLWADRPVREGTPEMVPVGMFAPAQWRVGLSVNGTAGWGADRIYPGQSLSGLQITSYGPPGIREIMVKPKLTPPTMEQYEREEYQRVRQLSAYKTKTLGPTAPPAGSVDYSGGNQPLAAYRMLDRIDRYITEAQDLGWLNNATLAAGLSDKLATVRDRIQQDAMTEAKTVLSELMALLDTAAPDAYTSEGYGLLYFNAKYLRDKLPDTPIPAVLLLDMEPLDDSHPVGGIHSVTVTYTADGKPKQGALVNVKIVKGPHGNRTVTDNRGRYPFPSPPGSWIYGGVRTDANGQATLNYPGKHEGTDELVARIINERGVSLTSEPTQVTWEGGADLVASSFIPPLIETDGEPTHIHIYESTVNRGSSPAPATINRFYLSTDEDIDPRQDTYLGERPVKALAPGEETSEWEGGADLPALPKGTYHIGVCVDAARKVVETDETNNCTVNGLHATAVPFKEKSNTPPDCSTASLTQDALWPPNHKMARVGIKGVTDPDGDAITITVDAITQDEPVNGTGDGDTAPDAVIRSNGTFEVRAERSGNGNGRVYGILFTADDGNGGSCGGNLGVVVPHARGDSPVLNDGQTYDSTTQ